MRETLRKMPFGFYVLALVCVIWGGTKPSRPTVAWDDLLTDSGSSISTNDARAVTFAWSFPNYIPAASTVDFYAILRGAASEDDMFLVASVPVSARTVTATMPTDATNYLYSAVCSYVPPTPVRTNGVYHLDAIKIDDSLRLVPLGVFIEDNGRRVSPPEGANAP